MDPGGGRHPETGLGMGKSQQRRGTGAGKGGAGAVRGFHHWGRTENGRGLRIEKPLSDRGWDCGFVSDSLYAAFPHLYFAGQPRLAKRFVTAARRYRENEG